MKRTLRTLLAAACAAFAAACADPGGAAPSAEPTAGVAEALLTLTPFDVSSLGGALASATAACASPFTFCSVDAAAGFRYAGGSAAEAAAAADAEVQAGATGLFPWAQPRTRAELGAERMLDGGLLEAVDALVGAGRATPLRGWYVEINNGSCHNCTEYDVRIELVYPTLGKVVVIDGRRGFDS